MIFPLIFRRHFSVLTSFCATKWTLKPLSMIEKHPMEEVNMIFSHGALMRNTARFLHIWGGVGISCARGET